LGLSFTFILFLPSLASALLSCVTVTSQVAYQLVFKFQDPQV